MPTVEENLCMQKLSLTSKTEKKLGERNVNLEIVQKAPMNKKVGKPWPNT